MDGTTDSKWNYVDQRQLPYIDRPINGSMSQGAFEYQQFESPNPPTSSVGFLGLGTTVVYNDIILSDCSLKMFDSEVLYDPSRTDQIGRKIKLMVECSYSPDQVTRLEHQSRQAQTLGLGIDESLAGINLGHNRPQQHTKGSYDKHPYKLESVIKGLLSRRGRPLYVYTASRLILCVLGHADLAQWEYSASDLETATQNTEATAIIPEGKGVTQYPLNDIGNSGDALGASPWMQFFDTQNGPKPANVEVTYIAGYKHFRVKFSIEASVVDGLFVPYLADDRDFPERSRDYYPAGAANQARKSNQEQASTDINVEDLGILSNRWSVSESRDASFFMQRVTQGKIIVRSMDTFATMKRHLCIPPLARGFQRISMKFIQSPDGLSMDYTVVDQQRYAAPPWPAIDWSGTHREEVEAFGFTGVGQCTVTLRGAAGTSKVLLFQAAIKTIEHRFNYKFADNDQDNGGNLGDRWVVPLKVVIEDKLHEPIITVSATVQRTPDIRDDKRKEGDPQTFVTQQYGAFIIGMLGKLPAQHATARDDAGLTDDEKADRDDVPVKPNSSGGEQEGSSGGVPNPDYKNMYSYDRWPTPLAYDTNTPAAHMAAYLQEPNLPYHAIPLTDWKAREHNSFPERDYTSPGYEEPKNPKTDQVGVLPQSPDMGTGKISVFRGSENAEFPARDTTWPVSGAGGQVQTSEEQQQFQYSHYEIESKYCTAQGIQGVPISGFPQSAVGSGGESSSEVASTETLCFVKMHQPITYRTIYIKAYRYGAEPEIPILAQERYDPNGIRELLVDQQIIPSAPQITTNQKMYESCMELHAKYALSRTPTPQEKLIAGSKPYDNTTPAANTVVVADVSTHNIM